MNGLDILGTSLGFIGSVIFSAGLLKSSDQIRDENGTYFNGNPFTLRGELSSQPYYLVGILLLIAGFAVSLGGMLSEQFASSSVGVAILISLCITLTGFLATSMFYISREKAHQRARAVWIINIFKNAVRSGTDGMRAAEEASDKVAEFTRVKETIHKDLLEKNKQIPEPYGEREQQLISAISKAKSATSYRNLLEKYLDEVKS